ncbi:MAG: hypothetical protein H7X86_12200 [Gorillibacterium sp.]|nr:hypothetical protein [Gorillibacterium sp.]
MHRMMVLMLYTVLLLASGTAQAFSDDDRQEYMLIVKASPNASYESAMPLPKGLKRSWLTPKDPYPASPPVTDIYLRTAHKTYDIDERLNLYDPATKAIQRLPVSTKKKLNTSIEALRNKHYGKLITWQEAKVILPLHSKFSVIDLTTGQQFRVERRAGSSHADVQPLSKQDTSTMKAIYDGKWSWKRRAILVKKDSEVFAASMHGMPHGGDGIPDNGFNGHFCIHFLGSITHRTGNQDPDHEVMIHKAAGELLPYVRRLPLSQLAELFLIAFRQQDPEILAVLFDNRQRAASCADHCRLTQLDGIRTTAIQLIDSGEDNPLTADATVTATAFRDNEKMTLHIRLHFGKGAPGLPWILESAELQGPRR